MHLLPRPPPGDSRLLFCDFVRIGDTGLRLRRERERAALERAKRAHHEVGAEAGEPIVQIARRGLEGDRHALRHGNRAGVQPFLHFHRHHPCLRIPRHDRTIDRCGAAPARQERGM